MILRDVCQCELTRWRKEMASTTLGFLLLVIVALSN